MTAPSGLVLLHEALTWRLMLSAVLVFGAIALLALQRPCGLLKILE
jgi:drug/metabolite transporter (DMT)-like permease